MQDLSKCSHQDSIYLPLLLLFFFFAILVIARNGSSPQVGNEEEEKRILVTGNASTIFVEPEELFDDEDPDADLDL